ncbi:MAG: 3-isopropylmalate dehydratase, small subunit [Hyphomicrobiales bacterium]|jgi:3-isopropylmalate/(R)-2-methylmalate dehydratase small subunit|nr:3-isopropylmalate dehydratase, small subunit [Hyphomicrobiales bacterium]
MMSGRAFVFGDGIDTDVLAPGVYMKLPIEQLAQHCLESIDPDFVRNVRPGDIVVGGANFGVGSSREQAAEALKHLGVACVIAKSFGAIFYRNALNFGLPVLVCAEADKVAAGDRLNIDAGAGRILDETQSLELTAQPLPGFLLQMIADGGLVPHLERRFAAARDQASSPSS